MSGLGFPHVAFGMYSFESVRWAWDELWAAVQRRVPELPRELTHSGDVHARWYDADCLVTHVCGAPFAAIHHTDMALVGAFDLTIDEADGVGRYRSVLLSPHDVPLDRLIGDDRRVAANSADSLSGWLSLLAATVGPGSRWPGPVTFTSAHVDSVRALAKGEADLAAIDPWSLAFIRDEQPELLADLRQVALGPSVPTPAIAARRSLPAPLVADLRDAFRAVLADETTAGARSALRIAGFADNDLDDYRATLAMAPD